MLNSMTYLYFPPWGTVWFEKKGKKDYTHDDLELEQSSDLFD